ncbi:MAG: RNA ligase family protein, partial [Thermoflexibacteraceae bacterium]
MKFSVYDFMSSFVGYEKMPTLLKGFQLDEKSLREIDKYLWVVTEKIHGANFSCWYENKQLRFAKRKEYLQWTDDFFGFQLVVQQIEEKILALFEQLSIYYPAKRYTVYGELFGGVYPHPNVPPVEHLQAIQTGIYYSPNINFCAFDIAIEPDEEADNKLYLPYQEALLYFEQFDIFHAKPLFIGKLHEVMQFDIRIPSTIPAQLGLPLVSPNLIEGIVVKPYKALPASLPKRIIFKVKNPEFDESKEFHEAQKWSYVPVLSA